MFSGHEQQTFGFVAQNHDAAAERRRGGRPPRAGTAADHVLRVRLTPAEHQRLEDAAAAQGRPVADHVRTWIAGEEPPTQAPDPPPPPSFVIAKSRPGVEPDLFSRWTPRYVFTLHIVPGKLEGPPLCVRRRVLGDNDLDGHRVETPSGDMSVNFDKLQGSGIARAYGSHRASYDDEPTIAGRFWGCDLAIDVYDHEPTDEERADWLRRHRLVQAVLRSPPRHVWVTFAGARPGAPDRAVKCRAWRSLGAYAGDAVERPDLNIALPGYVEPGPQGGVIRNRLTVDLYELATATCTAAKGESGQPHAVYLHKPHAEQLRADGKAREPVWRKQIEEAERRAREAAVAAAEQERQRRAEDARWNAWNATVEEATRRAAEAWDRNFPGQPNPFRTEDPGAAAVFFFGLDPATATRADVNRVFNERALKGHQDHGGTGNMDELVRMRDAARAYIERRSPT